MILLMGVTCALPLDGALEVPVVGTHTLPTLKRPNTHNTFLTISHLTIDVLAAFPSATPLARAQQHRPTRSRGVQAGVGRGGGAAEATIIHAEPKEVDHQFQWKRCCWVGTFYSHSGPSLCWGLMIWLL